MSQSLSKKRQSGAARSRAVLQDAGLAIGLIALVAGLIGGLALLADLIH